MRIAAQDRHRSPVGFKEEEGSLASIIQCEYTVGDHCQFRASNFYFPLDQSMIGGTDARGHRQFVFMDETDVAIPTARQFKGNRHIRNENGMVKEHASNGMVIYAESIMAGSLF